MRPRPSGDSVRSLLLLLLLPFSLAAQTASKQTCTVQLPSNTQSSYSCTLPNPVTAGDTLVFEGVAQVSSITDTQGNVWSKDVATQQLQFWHAAAQAGADTITANLSSPGGMNGVFAEYPPTTGVSVTSIAGGSGTSPISPSITTTSSGILIGFGTQWTNSYEAPVSTGTGFSVAKFGPAYLEDELVSGGTFTASAVYSHAVTWYIGAAFLNTVAPPGPLNFNLTTKLVSCVKCDRTDDSPLQGSIVFAQGQVSNAFSFAADGTVSVNVSINMTADPVVFSVFLDDANGNQVTGSGWQWSVPRSSLSAGVATLGTLKFGGLAFTRNADGSVSFAGFLP